MTLTDVSTDVAYLVLLFQVKIDPPQELLDAGADVLASQNRTWGDSDRDRSTFSKVSRAGWVGVWEKTVLMASDSPPS